MEATIANEDAIETILRVNPSRDVESSLNKQKFAVGVPNSDRQRRKTVGNVEKKKDSEPFVFKVVTKAKLPVKVWKVGGTDAGGFGDGRK